MIINEKDARLLKRNLNQLLFFLEGQEEKYHEDIKFAQSMIERLSTMDSDINKIVYNQVGNGGYIGEIIAGGHVHLTYDKYHNQVITYGLDSHIDEEFEYYSIDMVSGEVKTKLVILTHVEYKNENLNIKFSDV